VRGLSVNEAHTILQRLGLTVLMTSLLSSLASRTQVLWFRLQMLRAKILLWGRWLLRIHHNADLYVGVTTFKRWLRVKNHEIYAQIMRPATSY